MSSIGQKLQKKIDFPFAESGTEKNARKVKIARKSGKIGQKLRNFLVFYGFVPKKGQKSVKSNWFNNNFTVTVYFDEIFTLKKAKNMCPGSPFSHIICIENAEIWLRRRSRRRPPFELRARFFNSVKSMLLPNDRAIRQANKIFWPKKVIRPPPTPLTSK